MSFSFDFEVEHGKPVRERTIAAYKGTLPNSHDSHANQVSHGTGAEAIAAVEAASDAVTAMLAGLGDQWAAAYVTVSGHVNPSNLKAEGWANDGLHVVVSVKSYK
jgi:hypothetical protein